jgi:hypothetical protein
LIGEAGRVFKRPKFGLQVPYRTRPGDPLIVTVVEHDTTLGDHLVLRLVEHYLVCLEAVDAVLDVDIARIDEHPLPLLSFDGLVV